MKKIITFCMAMLFLTACGSQKQQSENGATNANDILYTNLADTVSQKEVTEILQNYGVTKEQTDILLSWADDFNERVTAYTLPEGFQKMGKNGVQYDDLVVSYKELADGEIVPEANCRLTSYLLMKNMIQTNGKQLENDTFLMFDIEAIDMYPQFQCNAQERSDFITLFHWIPVDGTTTLEEHKERMQTAWADREIKINGDGISLINVYIHSTFENVRFVGHTGVLVQMQDGLLFVEKYGPLFPFQATKFQNREALKNYLQNRPDLYGDETELKPIIMENDTFL